MQDSQPFVVVVGPRDLYERVQGFEGIALWPLSYSNAKAYFDDRDTVMPRQPDVLVVAALIEDVGLMGGVELARVEARTKKVILLGVDQKIPGVVCLDASDAEGLARTLRQSQVSSQDSTQETPQDKPFTVSNEQPMASASPVVDMKLTQPMQQEVVPEQPAVVPEGGAELSNQTLGESIPLTSPASDLLVPSPASEISTPLVVIEDTPLVSEVAPVKSRQEPAQPIVAPASPPPAHEGPSPELPVSSVADPVEVSQESVRPAVSSLTFMPSVADGPVETNPPASAQGASGPVETPTMPSVAYQVPPAPLEAAPLAVPPTGVPLSTVHDVTPSLSPTGAAPRIESSLSVSQPDVARVPVRSPEQGAFVITVGSSKGGVGKSTIAANLAGLLAKHYKVRTMIIDLDISSGDLRSRLDARGKEVPSITTIVRNGQYSADAVRAGLWQHPDSGMWALFAPTSARQVANNPLFGPGTYQQVLDAVRGDFDVIVLDAPPSFDRELMLQFGLPNANGIVLVIDNERATVVGLRQNVDLLKGAHPTLDSSSCVLLLNQRVEGAGLSNGDIQGLFDQWKLVASLPEQRKEYVQVASAGDLLVLTNVPAAKELRRALEQVIHHLMPWLSSDSGAAQQSGKQKEGKVSSWLERQKEEDPVLRFLTRRR